MKNMIRSPSVAGVGMVAVPKIALIAFANAAAASTLYTNQYVLQSVAKDFPVNAFSYALPGATFAGYAVGVLLAAFARFKCMYISEPAHLGILAVALAAAGVAPNVLILVVSSLLIGVGAAVIPRLLAAAPSLVAPRARRMVIGLVVSTTLMGIIGARLIVEPISTDLGWRAPFLISSMSIGLLCLFLRFFMPPRPVEAGERLQVTSARGLWHSYPRLRRTALHQAVLFSVFNISWATALAEYGAEDVRYVTVMAGATGVAAAWLTGILPVGHNYRAVRRVATVAMVVAEAVALPIAYSTSSTQLKYGLMTIGMSLVELSMQSGLVSNQAFVQELDPAARGRLSAMLTAAGSVGGSAGSAAAGFLLQSMGWTSAIGLAAALSLIPVFCTRTRPHDVAISDRSSLTGIPRISLVVQTLWSGPITTRRRIDALGGRQEFRSLSGPLSLRPDASVPVRTDASRHD